MSIQGIRDNERAAKQRPCDQKKQGPGRIPMQRCVLWPLAAAQEAAEVSLPPTRQPRNPTMSMMGLASFSSFTSLQYPVIKAFRMTQQQRSSLLINHPTRPVVPSRWNGQALDRQVVRQWRSRMMFSPVTLLHCVLHRSSRLCDLRSVARQSEGLRDQLARFSGKASC